MNTMKKKANSSVTHTDGERELPKDLIQFFPNLSESDTQPTQDEIRKKILELHNNGDVESAQKLLKWKESSEKVKPPSRYSKITTIIVFVLVLIIGGLVAFWTLSGGSSNNATIVVCKIGNTHESGDACLSPQRLKSDTVKKKEKPSVVQPGTTN